MIILPFLVVVGALALLYLISASLKTSKESLPPGPWCIPLLGNLVQLAIGGPLHFTLSRLAVKYGKMYTVYLARKPILVLNDFKLMKAILSRAESTGRVPAELSTMLSWSGKYGIFNTGGNEWLEQRQFFVKTFIQFGFGQENRMEPLGIAEANKLCEWMDGESKREKGNKILVNRAVVQCTNNLMWAMFTGQTTEQMQPHKIFELIPEWLTYLLNLYKLGKMKLLKHVAPKLSGYMNLKELCKEIQECIELQFKEHRESRVEGQPPRDIIDAYIEKVENCRDTASTFYGELGWKHSYSSTLQNLLAGADSTGEITTWILYYLSVHKEVQSKLQREIDYTFGRDRAPALEDKKSMPYMQAVILEGLRLSSAVPLGGRVTLLEDVVLDGYRLPKGTLVLSNLYFVNHDKTIWGDPENFRPERFLKEGNEHLKEMMVTFQLGKRTCPGSHFAKDILFLFVAKLLQKFTFSVDPDVENPREYLEQIPGLMRKPKDLALVVMGRK